MLWRWQGKLVRLMEVAQYSTVKPASGEFPKQHVTRVNAPAQTRNKAWVAFHLLFPETHALDAKALVAANSFSCFLVPDRPRCVGLRPLRQHLFPEDSQFACRVSSC